VLRKLKPVLRHRPTADDIVELTNKIQESSHLKGGTLLRSYFYHAPPYSGVLTNPINQTRTNYSETDTFSYSSQLLDQLELKPNFALRLGEISNQGWKLGNSAMRNLVSSPRQLQPNDLQANLVQKGVDLRIGLDISRLAFKNLADVIVVVTGDSDLIPAFKLARREGIKIYLDHLGHGIKRDLKAHADVVLTTNLN